MASNNGRTPWHQVVKLRDELRSGEFSLTAFAADLYDVVMGQAKPMYQKPEEFFALTYPTFNLRELAKDVMLRLAGKNDRAVRQLELTYGGGKTHALITLYHLTNSPEHLPSLPSVQEFRAHASGLIPPKARIAILAFDKLDPITGMEVRDPDGKARRLMYPWSVLAYQLGGDQGLRILGQEAGGERQEPPFTNVLEDILRMPAKSGLSTLVLIDEVLMWARTKIGADPVWRHRIQDFFQCLTQAAAKVDRTCITASLLATDPRKSDELGKEIARELHDVFRREREEGVQPVEKQDVAEILRRRFFAPEYLHKREAFRSQVVAALEGIQALDEVTQKKRKEEEDRYLESYPFHPDMTEAFYSKWTQLGSFQRTRGVLRIFATALRDSEKWDVSPVVGVNVLLNGPGKSGLSEALRELASIATFEEYEGKQQNWSAILEGELKKARDIQDELPAIEGREIEQAVVATFLHSQPIGQKALTRDLLVLLGTVKPDRIELEKGLRRWAEMSWFLDEAALVEGGNGGVGTKELPKTWRLGNKPNLKQMHSVAVGRVQPDLVEMKLTEFIFKEKRLTAGGSQAGARVHNLPQRPRDVEDDGEFHYVVLGPGAASEVGKPSNEARRFIIETTSPDRPRIYQNAILLLVPSKDGLELLRNRVRDYLGWEEVAGLPETKAFDDLHKALLKGYAEEARRKVPDAVVQAYNIVVTTSIKGKVEAFRIAPGEEPQFEMIKKDKRSRIQESAISPEALLPGGPYDLWKAGETSRRASDLVRAFA
ncbi:MAG: ATP-binding protein, partial [Chloroflexi bacterium]|nr:ATP-binding protein [Chloroflexota bacterium]